MQVKKVYLALNWSNDILLQGIARYAKSHAWSIHITRSFEPYWPEETVFDGVICVIPQGSPDAEQAINSSIPVVDLACAEPSVELYRVLTDNLIIGHEAAEYFLGKAYRRFVTVNFTKSWIEQDRLQAFEESISLHGLECGKLLFPEPDEYNTNKEKAKHWLKDALGRLPKPIALFAGNDLHALLVLECCMECDIRIPEEIAVMGVDNDEIACDYALCPLTSVDSDLEEVGYLGARMLDQLMHGESLEEKTVYVPPKGIVSRMSTDFLATQNHGVKKALEFIHEHYRKSISVDDVVRHSGVSRTQLYQDFQQELQRSIAKEISRLRIGEVKRLLNETDYKTQQIAEECGFNEQSSLCRAFKRETGLTLSEYKALRY